MRSAPLLVLAAAAGCGGAQDQANREAQRFSCDGRIASYVATHHLAGDEVGVQLECPNQGPRILRWRSDKLGQRVEDTRSMTPGEFDRIWRSIEGTGWQNLRDCTTGSGGKDDPIYVFDIRDESAQATFQCQSVTMPHPYYGLVHPLDLAAHQGRPQLGGGEPAR